MRNLLLTLCFDGTDYHGWQVQANAVTVQQTLQDAVEAVFGVRENVTGCSRTDSGVHANKYCCNIKTLHQMPVQTVVSALNAHLPDSISVTACEEREPDFHARYSCKRKEYIYRIWNSRNRNPFLCGYALQYKYPLDADFLSLQAGDFEGKHDFAALCAAGSSVANTVRTVDSCRVERFGDEVRFTVSADGFLYNMVRIMVGTLLDISSGKLSAGSIAQIITSGNRANAGFTAAPHGLYLNDIWY